MGEPQACFEYNQETMKRALMHIDQMEADMISTEILEPLSHAIDDLAPGHKEVRIFLLTDGEIDDKEKVIEKCNTGSDKIRIHTFGIGSGSKISVLIISAFIWSICINALFIVSWL